MSVLWLGLPPGASELDIRAGEARVRRWVVAACRLDSDGVRLVTSIERDGSVLICGSGVGMPRGSALRQVKLRAAQDRALAAVRAVTDRLPDVPRERAPVTPSVEAVWDPYGWPW